MHRMTGEAGEAAAPRARRLLQGGLLAPGDAHAAVAPEVVLEEPGRRCRHPGCRRPADEEAIVAQDASGPVRPSVRAPVTRRPEDEERMALSAHVAGTRGGQS